MVEDETLRTLANAEIFKGLTHDEVKIFYDASQRVTCEKPATVIKKTRLGQHCILYSGVSSKLICRLEFMCRNKLEAR
jgi:hypothetical protein